MHVAADVRVAVVEVAVPLAAVLAADLRVAGGDGGEGVALPYGNGPQRLLPVARERRVALEEGPRREVRARCATSVRDASTNRTSASVSTPRLRLTTTMTSHSDDITQR